MKNSKQRLIEFRAQMNDNIIDMNNIIRLLDTPEYCESQVLEEKFKELMKETKDLTEQYNMLSSLEETA